MRRLALAIVAFPFLFFLLYYGAVHLLSLQAEPFNMATASGIATWFILGTSYVLVFPGLPLFFLAARLKWLRLWHAAAVGATVGLMVFVVPSAGMLFDNKLRLQYRVEQLASMYPAALFGMVGGVLFWVLAVWRNPRFTPLVVLTRGASTEHAA